MLLSLELRIDGKTKIFTQDFISGLMFRKTAVIQDELKQMTLESEALDKMANYIVELYGNQFTVDEFYNGIAANRLLEVVNTSLDTVVKEVNGAMGGPNGKQAKRPATR